MNRELRKHIITKITVHLVHKKLEYLETNINDYIIETRAGSN